MCRLTDFCYEQDSSVIDEKTGEILYYSYENKTEKQEGRMV